MAFARRVLLLLALLGSIALVAAGLAATVASSAVSHKRSVKASRKAILQAAEHRVVGLPGTPTIHLRGFKDFDEGPAPLGTGNRSHGNEALLNSRSTRSGASRKTVGSDGKLRGLGRLRELSSLRTVDSDTFESATGVYVARVYTHAVNYKAAGGKLEPINDNLRRAGQFVIDRADTDRLRLPVRINRPVSVAAGGNRIRLRLLGASRSARVRVQGAVARYADAYPGTAVSMQAIPGSLELSFTLANPKAQRVFRVSVHAPKGSSVRLLGGVLRVINARGRVQFKVPAPSMLERPGRGRDLAPSYAAAKSVRVSLLHRDGQSVLIYTISRAWLKRQTGRFPVVLDPQVLNPQYGSSDCTVSNIDESTAPCNAALDDIGAGINNPGYAAGTSVTMMNFPQDPGGIPADSEVLGASLSFDVASQINGVSYAVLPMSDSFTPGEGSWVYSDAANQQKWQCPGGDYAGCQTGTPSSIAGIGQITKTGPTSVSITALAQAWVDGSQPTWHSAGQSYVPLMLYPTSTNGLAAICRVGSTGSSAAPCNTVTNNITDAPYLSIYYTPRLGSDPGSTIPLTSLGHGTSVGLNLASGEVEADRSDLSIPGTAGLNLTLGHSYNGNLTSGAWTLDQPASLTNQAGVNDAEVLTQSDGNQSVWALARSSTWGANGVYSPPAGTNASLCEALPNGNPASAADSTGQPYAFWVGSNGQIQGSYYNITTTSWASMTPTTQNGQPTIVSTAAPNSSPAVAITGAPATSTSPSTLQIYVAYVDTNQRIALWTYSAATGAWVDAELGGPVGLGTSPAIQLNGSGNPVIFYNNGTDNTADGSANIDEFAYGGGSWNASPQLVASGVEPNTSPAAVIEPSGLNHVFYVAGSSNPGSSLGVVAEVYSSGGAWTVAAVGGNVAPNTSPAVVRTFSNAYYMAYVEDDGNGASGDQIGVGTSSGGTTSWPNSLVNGATDYQGSVDPNTSPAIELDSSGDAHVYYTGSDGRFAELVQTSPGSTTWNMQDPLSLSVAANTSPSAPVYGTTGAGTLTPFYIGSIGSVHEVSWNPGVGLWEDQSVGGSVGLNACTPKNPTATWELTYNNSGQRLDFNAVGQLITEYDRNGNAITYAYNGNGTVATITDSQKRTYTYNYNASGQLTSITDNAGGRSFGFGWTGSQLTSDTDLKTNTTHYNTSGVLSSIQDPNGNTTTISYPTHPAGAAWQVNITTPANSTSGGPETTQYVSYPQGTPPPAGTPTCGGSPSGELPYGYTIETLPDGNWHEYCYDTHDRVYETFDDATQQPTLTTYDANDDVTGVVDPTNTEYGSPTLVTSSTFDACFRQTSQTTGLGTSAPTATESYTKPASTSCTATSPNDYQPATSTKPGGTTGAPSTTHYIYDQNGNLLSETDGLAKQNTLTFDYNANGTLADSWNANGSETTYSYVTNFGQYGNSGLGASYPAVLYSATVTPPGNTGTPPVISGATKPSTTTYDLDGRVLTSTDGNGNQVKIPTSGGYDADDNVLLAQYYNSSGTTGQTTNVYDSDGNLLHSADTQSGETGTSCYSYWPDGQLDVEQDPVAPGQTGTGTGTGSCSAESVTSTSYGYNGNGDMTLLTDGGGPVSYAYDNKDRVHSITQPGTSTPFTFTYDNDGRLVCTAYPNGMVTEQLYDAYNNLADIQTANGAASCNPASTTGTPSGTVFQNNLYTYAAGSNLQQSQTITQNGTSTAWNYYYDPLNRLLEAAGSGSAGTYNYSYDGDGNLLTRTSNATTGAIQTAAYNADNELCWVYAGSAYVGTGGYSCSSAPTGDNAATYDTAGNMQTVGSASGTTTLGYNDQEQTNSINPYGAGPQTFGYRGKGQNDPFQIGSIPSGGSAAPGLEEDALGISAQYPGGNGSTLASSYTYYTRAPNGTLLAERGSGGSTSTADYYYVQDANGSVVALTNSSDAVANTYTYDPYGSTTATTGSTANNFGFDGGFYANCASGSTTNCPPSTTANGLILFGTRYYNPATATWTQPDPAAQSLATSLTQSDAYSFAAGDPTNSTDPSGLVGVGTPYDCTRATTKHRKQCVAAHEKQARDSPNIAAVVASHIATLAVSEGNYIAASWSNAYSQVKDWLDTKGADEVGGCLSFGSEGAEAGPYAMAVGCASGAAAAHFGVDLAGTWDQIKSNP